MLKQMTEETARYIQSKTDLRPKIAMVLGSGLGGLGEALEDAVAIPYEEIPHFVKSTAPGHKGRILVGKLQGVPVLCMQGRFHFYEGYTMQQITYPVRAMKTMGVETIVLTNACGGLDPSFTPGDLMLVTDHINFQGTNPLIGANEDDFGTRFPDMTRVYTREWQDLARAAAKDLGVKLQEGTYISYTGPSFETPAEIRLFQSWGGGVVGMSTVPEAIVAAHSGVKVLAISCVTNLAAGILDVPLSGDEVIEVADRVGKTFAGLLTEIVKRMGA